jgi:hypothetical protein
MDPLTVACWDLITAADELQERRLLHEVEGLVLNAMLGRLLELTVAISEELDARTFL